MSNLNKYFEGKVGEFLTFVQECGDKQTQLMFGGMRGLPARSGIYHLYNTDGSHYSFGSMRQVVEVIYEKHGSVNVEKTIKHLDELTLMGDVVCEYVSGEDVVVIDTKVVVEEVVEEVKVKKLHDDSNIPLENLLKRFKHRAKVSGEGSMNAKEWKRWAKKTLEQNNYNFTFNQKTSVSKVLTALTAWWKSEMAHEVSKQEELIAKVAGNE